MAASCRAINLPGNGCRDVWHANWYGEAHKALTASGLFSEVILRQMPDPDVARESIWLPFIQRDMRADADTVVIGHSSGAEAAMRLLEVQRLRGVVLVSACHTDLGMPSERAAGYYSRPWKWEAIAANAAWILQYHSAYDPFIPRAEADFVAGQLRSDYTCFDNRSHFFTWPDIAHIVPAIAEKLAAPKASK